MLWKVFMIQPDSEFTAAHEFFAILIKFFVMGQIEIVNKSTSSYCFMNPDFLLFCRMDFRLEAL